LDYNVRFKENVQLVGLGFVVLIVVGLCVFDAKENDVNSLVGLFS